MSLKDIKGRVRTGDGVPCANTKDPSRRNFAGRLSGRLQDQRFPLPVTVLAVAPDLCIPGVGLGDGSGVGDG
jgi:hypothetical protein